MSTAITVKGISKTFHEDDGTSTAALRNISLSIKTGEFFVILGPSGSGKSTLLRIMSELETSDKGSVTWNDVCPNDCAFVFQQFALLPWLTVFENVSLGLLSMKLSKAEITKRVTNRLRLLGLQKFAKHYPRELSGGMKQRVGFARALVVNPKVLFLDEPFSELDTFTAEALRKELLELWEKEKFTVVMVTHNVDEAIELADRVTVLTTRPGTVEAVLPIGLNRPRSMRSPEVFDLHDKITNLVKP